MFFVKTFLLTLILSLTFFTNSIFANTQLNLALNTEPPSLDWHKSNDSTSARIILNIMGGLTTHLETKDVIEVKPSLAKKWSSEKNNTRWSFELITGCKWSDGVPLTPQHFVNAVERLLNPNTASVYAYFLFPLKGAQDYNSGKLKDFSKVGVKAEKNKLIFDLRTPVSFFPHLMTHFSTFPIRKDIVKKHGSSWTKAKNIVSLGSYNLAKWKHDESLILKENPNSCLGKPATPVVKFYIIPEATTGINLFKQKSLHAFEGLPSIDIPAYSKNPSYAKKTRLSIYYLGFNTTKAPFNNPKVRQAFAMAVNNKTIVKVLNGGQIPITGWLPPRVLGYTDKPYMSYNPKKAKQLLNEAGYSDVSKLPKITLGYNTNEDHKRVMEIVQAQVKKNLGVTLNIQNQEWKVYLNQLRKDPPHIYRLGWFGDYPDPDNFLNLFTSYSKNNYTKWKNEEFDKLIDKGLSISNSKERAKIYTEAQKLMLSEAVGIPIMSGVNHALISKDIENYPFNSMGRFVLKHTKIKSKNQKK